MKMKCGSGFDSEDDTGFDPEDVNFDVEPEPFDDPIDCPRKFDNRLSISTLSIPDQRTQLIGAVGKVGGISTVIDKAIAPALGTVGATMEETNNAKTVTVLALNPLDGACPAAIHGCCGPAPAVAEAQNGSTTAPTRDKLDSNNDNGVAPAKVDSNLVESHEYTNLQHTYTSNFANTVTMWWWASTVISS